MTRPRDPRADGPAVTGDRDSEFTALRPHLERVAYATLGSRAEAEDVVQEAWLRLQRTAPGEVRDLRAWATTVVGRLALDELGSARSRREAYVGPWLPEPVVTLHGADGGGDPADRVTLEETVSFALLRVLETLSPAERTAFVLHDVFGLAFAEVGEVVGRSDAAVRQLAARARKHVEAGRPRATVAVSEAERRDVITAFARAAGDGDMEGLVAVLDPDVVWRSDGGGVVYATRKPLHGAQRVAAALLGFARTRARSGSAVQGALVDVNGEDGLLLQTDDGERSVLAFTVAAGRITAIDVQRNPAKLERAPWLG